MRYEYLIGFRHFTHRKGKSFISLISFISVAGITVGVMALIVVLSVMSGFDRELKSKIVGAQPHLIVVKQGGVDNPAETVAAIEALKLTNIVSVSPFVEGQVIVRSEQNATGAIIKGISPDDTSLATIGKYVRKGQLARLFDTAADDGDTEDVAGNIAIGYHIARVLGVVEGDAITVISPYLEKKGVLPKRAKTATFRVCSIFEFGMNSMDSTIMLLPIAAAQELFNLGSSSSGVAMRLENVFDADSTKKEVQRALGYPYWTQSWIDMNRSFFSALKVEKNVMAVLLFLIILVAGFNIVSTLIMVVMEKTKDIGVLMALGATKSSIMSIFLLQGTIVGCLGVLVGTVLGLAMTFNLNSIADFLDRTFGFEVFPSDIYYFNEIPTQINPDDIVIIVMTALVIAIFAGVYPAHRAASLHPVEALRYE